VDAAPGTLIRVVATIVENDSVFTGEVSVLTPDNSDACAQAADIKITKRKRAFYNVSAYLFHIEGEGDDQDQAFVSISIDTDAGAVPYSGASVSLSNSGGQMSIPLVTDGYYSVSTPDISPPFEAGEVRTLSLDFDRDGSVDATGSVQLPGSIEIIEPFDGSTTRPKFTARWTDSGTEVNPYSARYYLTVSSDTVDFFAVTEGLEFEIGDGSADSSFGIPIINSPLLPGDHSLEVMGINGDPWMFQGNQGRPAIVGENASGYISAYSIGASVDFTVGGMSKGRVTGQWSARQSSRSGLRPLGAPDAVRRYMSLARR